MKNSSDSRIGRVFRRVINIRSWADWERVKVFTLYLGYGVQRLIVPQKKNASESFNTAMQRLNISEEQLIAKQKALYRLSMVMLVGAFLIFIYSIYHLIFGTYRAALVSLIVMMIAGVLSFRYHFWYFQISQRKLGCTFNEWFKKGLLGEKK